MALMDKRLLLSFPTIFSAILSLSSLVVVARDSHGLHTTTTNRPEAHVGQLLIDTIYQFGDSIADAGNWMRENRSALCTTFPYGESYFHYATGRCSDGLIMADFYAKAMGLEFLNPYLEKDADFRDGVNFAVGGATALDSAYLRSKDIVVYGTNSTLSVQLGWFKEYLKSTCSSATDCKSKLGRSLILMEAIGGDDYHYVFANHSSFQLAFDLVPDVVQAIMDVVKEMIHMGVVNVVFPSAFPYGCLPYYLTLSRSRYPGMYDDLGCLVEFNKLAQYHNRLIQRAIQELRMTYPNATLIYADYYFAITSLLRNAASLGFKEDKTLTVCCGYGENPYNCNTTSTECGSLGVPVCPHPERRIQWDGFHLTQHAYMDLSNWMLQHTIIPQLSHASSF